MAKLFNWDDYGRDVAVSHTDNFHGNTQLEVRQEPKQNKRIVIARGCKTANNKALKQITMSQSK